MVCRWWLAYNNWPHLAQVESGGVGLQPHLAQLESGGAGGALQACGALANQCTTG